MNVSRPLAVLEMLRSCWSVRSAALLSVTRQKSVPVAAVPRRLCAAAPLNVTVNELPAGAHGPPENALVLLLVKLPRTRMLPASVAVPPVLFIVMWL